MLCGSALEGETGKKRRKGKQNTKKKKAKKKAPFVRHRWCWAQCPNIAEKNEGYIADRSKRCLVQQGKELLLQLLSRVIWL